MQIDLSEFQEVFFDEAAEHLAAMEEGLLGLETAANDPELLNSIFRCAHSIKGNSSMFGFNDITSFTHGMESLLDRMRDGTIPSTIDRVELLLRATDTLGALLACAKGEGTSPVIEGLMMELELARVGDDEPAGDALGLDAIASPLGAANEPVHPAELNVPVAAAVPKPPAPAREPKNAGTADAKHSSGESSSIRVSVEKVDELINLVGELAIAQSMVNQAIRGVALDAQPELQEAVGLMERSTRDLQERVMAVRMIPVGTIFRRFPRIIRDVAASLGKKVSVEIIGEETELDKQVIERLSDPLTHLVRNAVDHGLELPEERIAAGKVEEGTVRLSAFHEGGNVIIDVAEDGRGLDVEKIRKKALSLGLINGQEQMTDDQIRALVFLPGFSTAAAVTDISGRGVGMDVVKRNIEALNGSVSIESAAGKGTRFRIKLPLTMAILDGLSVTVRDEVYILPLLAVVESFRPQPRDVKTVLGAGEVVVVRGENLPLLRLYSLFHIEPRITDPTQGLIVIVENQGKKYGLLIDELLGQLQVVMKSIEANYHKVDGVSGATILGDGRVALIVDVSGLTRLSHLTVSRHPLTRLSSDLELDAIPVSDAACPVELTA